MQSRLPGNPLLMSRETAAVQNIIFDLDGTLVDSLPGIEESARAAIGRVLPDEPMPDLRSVIGPPIATMIAKLWPGLPGECAVLLLAEFRSHYDREGCLLAQAYPGVGEGLARFFASGVRLFVLTNKPLAPAVKILSHLGFMKYFACVSAPDSAPPFDSKPVGARQLAEKYALVPAATILVGDGADDAASAAACGFIFIAAAYGYGRAAEEAAIRVEKFSEIEYHLRQPDSRL